MSSSSTTEGRNVSQVEPPEPSPRSRVSRACERCRRQKLRCDDVQPCTLCRRAGIRCEPRTDIAASRPKRKKQRQETGLRTSRAPQPMHDSNGGRQQFDLRRDGLESSPGSQQAGSQESPSEGQRFGANSSAVGFAAHIFGSKIASHSDDISTIPGHGGQATHSQSQKSFRWSLRTMPHPPVVVMDALIDAYFDRLHWFILIFHETSFRDNARRALELDSWDRDQLGLVLAALMVAALGLQCVIDDVSWEGRRIITEASLDASALLEALIMEVRFHLIDLLDDCSIETVQVCSLLGTFYIFHGSPTLAWSILGLSVRTAYALALHCDEEQNKTNILAEVRRRNWNHIMVADTFAAMVYGRPISLDAAFSGLVSVHDLDDTALPSRLASSLHLGSNQENQPVSRLSFHVLKFRLYQINRQALNRFRVLRLQNPISVEELMSLTQTVRELRQSLDAWKAGLPSIFNFDHMTHDEVLIALQSDADQSANEQRIRRHLALQALTLQVTYDTAIIFTHRPLLEYRVTSNAQHAVPSQALDMVRDSLDLCVRAALRISWVPVVEYEKEFCLAFILMNFFTAGVILCIPPTIRPLSTVAHEAKGGALRVIRASRRFRNVSQVAAHTEQLLTRLLKLSLHQEIDIVLQTEGADNDTAGSDIARGANRGAGGIVGWGIPPTADLQLLSSDAAAGTIRSIQSVEPHDSGVDLQAATSLNSTHIDANTDVLWPHIGYENHLNQVDSQLDEAFGAFGQMLFELVPNDPYSAWNWGNGAV